MVLRIEGFGGGWRHGTGLIVQTTGSVVPALVVGALIGVGVGDFLPHLDQLITAVDMDAMSHPGVTRQARPIPR
jgi:hypothetical protein